MSRCRPASAHAKVALALTTLLALPLTQAQAGNGLFRNNSVGGVSISAEGVLGQPHLESQSKLLELLRQQIKQPSPDLNLPVGLRMVSLRGLEAAVQDALQNHAGQLSDEIKYLAGLQRIQYVFVYPEQNDIVLAGPAEGWKVDDHANIVGVTTGRPVLRLDDLLIALRTADAARDGGISCSIEPTEEGYRNLNNLLKEQRNSGARLNPAVLEPAMHKAFGPQNIVVQNVPASSHFARVLVAADYRMKRLAMKLDPSPVRGLSSYIDLIKTGREGGGGVNPRWWLACNYEPLARSGDGLAWELRGPGVKAMTEDSFVSKDGIKGTGRKSPSAEKWAEMMTASYNELSVKDPVFGELRNAMDMCVISALIQREGMLDRAGCSLPLLLNAQSDLVAESWNAPKTVAPQCSFVRTRKGWIVTASGGVQIDGWQIASDSQVNDQATQLRDKSTPRGNSWWWN